MTAEWIVIGVFAGLVAFAALVYWPRVKTERAAVDRIAYKPPEFFREDLGVVLDDDVPVDNQNAKQKKGQHATPPDGENTPAGA